MLKYFTITIEYKSIIRYGIAIKRSASGISYVRVQDGDDDGVVMYKASVVSSKLTPTNNEECWHQINSLMPMVALGLGHLVWHTYNLRPAYFSNIAIICTVHM